MTRKKDEQCRVRKRSASVLCSVWEGLTEKVAPGQGPKVFGNTSCRQVWAQRSVQREEQRHSNRPGSCEDSNVSYRGEGEKMDSEMGMRMLRA